MTRKLVTAAGCIKRVRRLMRRMALQRDTQSREETEPLVPHNVHSQDVSVKTEGGATMQLEQKSIQAMLRTAASLEHTDGSEGGSTTDLTRVVERLVSDNFAQFYEHKAVGFGLAVNLSKIPRGIQDAWDQGSDTVMAEVLEAFHHCVFVHFDQALQRDQTGQQALLLLCIVTRLYLSDKSMVCTNISDQQLKGIDPLILAHWLQNAERKHLEYTQNFICGTLRKILEQEENFRCSKDPQNEEDFIGLNLDIQQLLSGQISQADKVSKYLKRMVQKICFQELLSFIEIYVKREIMHLKHPTKQDWSNTRHQLRTLNTCIVLTEFVQKFKRDGVGDATPAVSHLGNMQSVALELLLKEPVSSAKTALKKYFKEGDGYIEKVVSEVCLHFGDLPLKGQEAHKMLVGVAYQRITSVYLQCLLLSNRKALENQWGCVGESVKKDADLLHRTFSQLNPEEPYVIQRNPLLSKVPEILQHRDVEALKLTCHDLLNGESHKQLHALLRWRGGLSRGQVREVMELSGVACPVPGPRRSPPLWSLCLCVTCCC